MKNKIDFLAYTYWLYITIPNTSEGYILQSIRFICRVVGIQCVQEKRKLRFKCKILGHSWLVLKTVHLIWLHPLSNDLFTPMLLIWMTGYRWFHKLLLLRLKAYSLMSNRGHSQNFQNLNFLHIFVALLSEELGWNHFNMKWEQFSQKVSYTRLYSTQ